MMLGVVSVVRVLDGDLGVLLDALPLPFLELGFRSNLLVQCNRLA
jgi:hypothetical protein